MKQLNTFLILILLIGLTNLTISQELHQVATRQITQPNINEQLPIVQMKTEQTKSTHVLPSEIKVGGVFPITVRPDAGPDRRDGFLIAINEINNQTGVDRILPEGVTLVPNVQDDLNTAAGGTAAAQTLISWGADIVIGSSGSSVSAAMATEFTPYKIPQISYASSSPTLSDRTLYPYFMRVLASDADQAKAIVDLVQAFNWTKGATICTDDSYGAGLITYFTNEFSALGGTIATAQQFSVGAVDVSSQVQAIKNSAPEFVLGNFIDVDATTVMAEAKLQGIDTIPWIMTHGWAIPSTFSGNNTVQDAMQKAIGTDFGPDQIKGPTYTTFNATWFDPAWNWLEGPALSQSTGSMFNSYAPFAYDAVYVAAKGLAKAGTTDGDSLLTALYDVTHEGASGSIEFNDLGEVYGRYNYVQLRDTTFHTFGKWLGTPSFDTGSIALNDGTGWLVLHNVFTTLTTRGTIFITNNNDLNTTFPGRGTLSDPIRIEGYNITASSGILIHIQDTTFYFEIGENYLNGSSTASRGIYFQNVIHGTIGRNLISASGQGITIYSSFNNTIINNTVNFNNYNGINVDYSDNNTIAHNTICNNIQQSGVWLDHANNNTISDNFCYNNKEDGIRVTDYCDDNQLINNTCFNNGWDGLRFQTYAKTNKIINCTAYGNDRGVTVEHFSEFNLVTGTTCYNNVVGFLIADSAKNNNITDNIAYTNNYAGIHIHEAYENLVQNNTAYDNDFSGIGILDGMRNTLSNNTVYDNAYGIFLDNSANNSLINNILTNNGFCIFALTLQGNLQDSVLNNTVNDEPLVYWQNITGGIVPSGAGQVILVNCTDSTVSNQNLSNASIGIWISFSSNIILKYNTGYNNRYGIYLYFVTNAILTNNTITNNLFNDIYLESSNNNNLTNNVVGNSTNYGITFQTSENNIFSNNTVFNSNDAGIRVLNSLNTVISYNIISNNLKYGILIDIPSIDIKVQFNDFIGNNIGGFQAIDNGSNNVFAYNYWSDWTSPDVDADGIVDTPYSIEGNSNNQDQYPLVISPTNHYLLIPIITSPSGGETLSGDVSISWSTSVDTWGYSVTYNVSYSTDGGTNWFTLMTNLIATTFIWDTSTVLDGSNYLLKVEAVSMGGINASFISTSTLTIDKTPPMVSIVSPLEQTYTTDMITVTLSGDANHFWYYIESVDSQNQTWTTSVDRTLTDGTYTLHVYGNDSVGNIAHVFVTFTISTTTTTTTTSTTTTTTTTTTPSSTTTTSATTTPTTTITPSWTTLQVLLSLFAMLSWKQRKKKT